MCSHLFTDDLVYALVLPAARIHKRPQEQSLQVRKEKRAHEGQAEDDHDQDQTQDHEPNEHVVVQKAQRHSIVGHRADDNENDTQTKLIS